MREAYILCVVGRQGGGKTYRQVQECLAYSKKRKVLVFDCNVPSGSYKDLPTIDYDCSLQDDYKHGKVVSDKSSTRTDVIKKWPEGVGARRVVNYRKDGNLMNAVEMNQTALDMMEHFRDGMLVFEDMNAYLIGVRALKFLSNFLRVRHNRVDLVLIMQSAGALEEDAQTASSDEDGSKKTPRNQQSIDLWADWQEGGIRDKSGRVKQVVRRHQGSLML